MQNTFSIFIANQDMSKSFLIYEDIISNSLKEFGEITIINFYKLLNKNKSISKNNFSGKEIDKRIKIFYPETSKEFEKYIKNKNIYAIDAIGKQLINFKIKRLLNRKNIYLILLTNLGFESNVHKYKIKNLKSFIFEIKKLISKFIYRFLVLVKIYPNIHYYFETREEIYNNCIKKRRVLLAKYLPFLNINYFQNVYRINSKASDAYKNDQIYVEDKIVFLDGNYKHGDIINRTNQNIEWIKKTYLSKLKKLFHELSILFNMKIEICLHPSSNINEYSEYFDCFNLSKYETQKKINEAYFVLFHESGSISDAILKKKRIISIKTNLFGDYISSRIKLYQDKLNLYSIDLDNEFNLEKKEIENGTKNSLSFMTEYIKKNIEFEKEKGVDKMFRIIKSNFKQI